MTRPPESSTARIWNCVFKGEMDEAMSLTQQVRSGAQESFAPGKSRTFALLAEPALANPIGHHLALANHYENWLAGHGKDLFVAHAYRHHLSPASGRLPYFAVPGHTLAHGPIESAVEMERVESYFTQEYKALIELVNPTLCLFGSVRFTNIVAAARAASVARSSKGTKVVMGVLEGYDVPDCSHIAIIRGAFERAAEEFATSGVPYRIVVETETIRGLLVDCGMDPDSVHIYQFVAATVDDGQRSRVLGVGEPIRTGYVGGSRPVRHPELIVDYLIQAKLPSNTTFCLQISLDYVRKHRGQVAVDRIRELADNGQVELHGIGLDAAHYNALLKSLDIVVLPYSSKYREIGSGVLIEAVCNGIVPICPEVSSLNTLYQSLGGEAPALGELTVEAIEKAINLACANIDALAQLAGQVRSRWDSHPQSGAAWVREMNHWVFPGEGNRGVTGESACELENCDPSQGAAA